MAFNLQTLQGTHVGCKGASPCKRAQCSNANAKQGCRHTAAQGRTRRGSVCGIIHQARALSMSRARLLRWPPEPVVPTRTAWPWHTRSCFTLGRAQRDTVLVPAHASLHAFMQNSEASPAVAKETDNAGTDQTLKHSARMTKVCCPAYILHTRIATKEPRRGHKRAPREDQEAPVAGLLGFAVQDRMEVPAGTPKVPWMGIQGPPKRGPGSHREGLKRTPQGTPRGQRGAACRPRLDVGFSRRAARAKPGQDAACVGHCIILAIAVPERSEALTGAQ